MTAAHYLAVLYAGAPAGSLIELRFRTPSGMGRSFSLAHETERVAARVDELAPLTDVYLGVLPRRRCHGARGDVVDEGRVLWVDCDTPASVVALRAFSPPPSIVMRSGSDENRHAYWLLGAPVVVDDIERTNRRLAVALGADVGCTDRARILRPPSLNHKHTPAAAVRLEHCDADARHWLADIVHELPNEDEGRARLTSGARARADAGTDPLLSLAPTVYVERLTGATVSRQGKTPCPFHADQTPSLHVYAEPERGWYCYGCGRGGSVFDFAAELWAMSTRGADFVALRQRLGDVLDGGPHHTEDPS